MISVKLLKTSALVFLFCFINISRSLGQIGIGTQNPHTSSVLDVSSNNKGVLIPKLTSTERDSISNPATGLMLYNKTRRCLEVNEGTPVLPDWVCVTVMEFASGVEVSCINNGFDGEFIYNQPLTSSHKFSVTILNNSIDTADFTFSGSDLTLSGVTGISVSSVSHTALSLPPGHSQKIEYNLSGTPNSRGILNGNWMYHNYLNCSRTIAINLPTRDLYVFSLGDASTSTNLQGILNNGDTIASIQNSFLGDIGTSYTSYVGPWFQLIGEGGDANKIRLVYDSGTLNATGSLTFKLEVDGDGSFLVKQQASGQSITLVDLPLVVNGISVGIVRLIAYGGIPDLNFEDNNYRFIYQPVLAANGSVWLNNNLGANYANLNHTQFNSVQQATASNDYHAYGSLFQWGRYSDGHELMNWSSSTSGTGSGTTTTNATSDTPGHSLFIREPNSPYDWRTPQNNNLWQGTNGINNPCPEGYRLPTNAEFADLVSSENITNLTTSLNSSVAFSAPGYRSFGHGALSSAGLRGYYWASTINGIRAGIRRANGAGSINYRAYGFSVRCIR